MWRKFLLCYVFTLFLNLSLNYGLVFAESVEVAAIGEYDVGGNDTRERAKMIAYENAKRNALEQVAVNIESRTNVSMGMVSRDTIISYAKGKMKIIGTPRYEFNDNGRICWAYIRAIVDVDIDELRNVKEKDISTGSDSSNDAEYNMDGSYILNDALQYNGHYYKNFEFRLDWEQAKKYCQSVGGHLATMESGSEAEVINKLRGKGGFNYWLGGYRDDQGLWRWVTGGVITDSYWKTGEPASATSRRNRMLIHRYDKSIRWYSHKDDETWPFICEWESKDDAHDSSL